MRRILPIILVFGAFILGTWMGMKPFVGPALGPTVRVDFLDVGGGESILIRTPDGANVLMDAGDDSHSGEVIDFLQRNGVSHLDYLIITSSRRDHIGGVPSVLKGVKIGAVLDGSIPVESDAQRDMLNAIADGKLEYAELRAGMNIPVGRSVVLEVLAPPSEEDEWSRNPDDDSAVIRLLYGRAAMLLTSDIQSVGEARLIAEHKDLESQVLKVADHGSSESTSLELLRLVRPEYLIVSAGDRGRRVPSRRTMERLSEERTGAAVLRTDQDGGITVRTDGRKIVVEKSR